MIIDKSEGYTMSCTFAQAMTRIGLWRYGLGISSWMRVGIVCFKVSSKYSLHDDFITTRCVDFLYIIICHFVSLEITVTRVSLRRNIHSFPNLRHTIDDATDVKLSLRAAGKLVTSFTSDLSFSFSSFINLQDIPLSCLAGPTLDVSTTSQITEDWLAKYLLDDTFEYESDEDDAPGTPETRAPWWAQGREQSDVGILLRVDGHASVTRFRLEVKEILLYAGFSDTIRKARESLITPPGSSSPNAYFETPKTSMGSEPKMARIYAKLLYSGFLWSRGAENQLPSTDATSTDDAQFMTPPGVEPGVTNKVQPETTKRRKVDVLFEEAARESKRSRKRGGENVAHVMAKGDRPSPVLFPHGLREMARTDSQNEVAVESQACLNSSKPKRAFTLSRSKSISSLKDLEESRPSSRHSNPLVGDIQKRSSLHRISSMNEQDDASSPAAEAVSRMEAQNRNALTRVVMAGLRLYGFQAKKKPPASITDQPSSSTADPDEEYKLLYHQTFRAAAFVFRKQIAAQWISQPALREVVDKLLGMFCVDPLKEQQQLGNAFMPSVPKEGEKGVGFGNLAKLPEGANSLDSELLFRKAVVDA